MVDVRFDRTLTGEALLPESVHTVLQEHLSGEKGLPHAMPPEFYTDVGVAALERQKLFVEGWICLGRADQIPDKGNYFVSEVMEESLIVVRTGNKRVRVFSNVCRHRSSLMLEGTGTARQIVCPYHNWSYRLDGSLLKAPLVEDQEGFDASKCSLPEFSCERWMGWIFVNLDGKAKSLNETTAALDHHVRNYHAEEMRTVKSSTEHWATNWKCLAENFMEGYHLTPVHLRTLHPMTPTRLSEKIKGGETYTAYKAHYDGEFEGRLPFHEDMTEEEKNMSLMMWIYPSFVAAFSPNSVVFLNLTPATVNDVRVNWGVVAREELFENGTAMDRYDFAASYNVEDKERLVDVQIGLHSRYATAGPLAGPNYEGCSTDFFNYVARHFLP